MYSTHMAVSALFNVGCASLNASLLRMISCSFLFAFLSLNDLILILVAGLLFPDPLCGVICDLPDLGVRTGGRAAAMISNAC